MVLKEIGNYCSMDAKVRYFNVNHSTDKFTTHPMIYNTTIVKSDGEYRAWKEVLLLLE